MSTQPTLAHIKTAMHLHLHAGAPQPMEKVSIGLNTACTLSFISFPTALRLGAVVHSLPEPVITKVEGQQNTTLEHFTILDVYGQGRKLGHHMFYFVQSTEKVNAVVGTRFATDFKLQINWTARTVALGVNCHGDLGLVLARITLKRQGEARESGAPSPPALGAVGGHDAAQRNSKRIKVEQK